ncbi:MAG: hypothetical protein ACRD1O_03835 [Terriglobia bacterium]
MAFPKQRSLFSRFATLRAGSAAFHPAEKQQRYKANAALQDVQRSKPTKAGNKLQRSNLLLKRAILSC